MIFSASDLASCNSGVAPTRFRTMMQDFPFYRSDCPFLEDLKGSPPILTSVSNTSTMRGTGGAGYTTPLLPPSPLTILIFLSLPYAILRVHKGDNYKYLTTVALQFPSLFPPLQAPAAGNLIPSALLLRYYLFWGLKEYCRGQKRWWRRQRPDLSDPSFILWLTPGSDPSPCWMLPGGDSHDNVIIFVARIGNLHISSFCGLGSSAGAASRPYTIPLTIHDNRGILYLPLLLTARIIESV